MNETAADHPSAQPLPRLMRFADLIDEWDAEAQALREAYVTGKPRGPVLDGFGRMPEDLGGALQVGVHIVHGGPGVGKTALGLQIASTCQCPALLVSCEMGRLELFRRHTARTTSTFLGKLKTGELPPDEMHELARRAVQAAPHLALADATRAPADPTWIMTAARGLRGESRHLLIVIDSVHSWAEGVTEGGGPEYEMLGYALARLRTMASELHCAILGIAERNRISMDRGGLNAAAGTRKFEYAAESVWDLTCKDECADVRGEVGVTLTLAKNRHGAAGSPIDLRFCGRLQRFQAG